LVQVVNNGEKQREMLLARPTNANRFSLHGLMIALLSKSFFYSHYYRICKDIDQYSKQTFDEHKYAIIQQKLEGIIITIGEKYLKLYDSCLKKHPNRRISLESDFIKNELNSYNQDLFSLGFKALEVDVADDLVVNAEEECFYCKEETFNIEGIEGFSENINPIFIKAKKNEKYFQMGWLESQVLLQQGSLFNHLLLYKDSIDVLSKAIKMDPTNVDAYIERAFAYFETNQLPLALKDYESFKKLVIVDPFSIGIKGLYSPENKIEFTKGLLSGVIAGAKISTVEFVPSILSSCRGILNGLWAFVCSPVEVSNEMSATAYAIGEFVSRNSANECLQCVVPELRELSLSWDTLKDHSKGEKIGFIIGKYGVDIFAPIAALKGVNKLRALRRANTTLTLESCIASQKKQAKILEESLKRAILIETSMADYAIKGGILVKNSNTYHHVMQKKHAWDKILKLTGNLEEDFNKMKFLLEEHKIMNKEFMFKSPKHFPEKGPKVIRSDHKKFINDHEVCAVFEKHIETGEIYLKDAWVITQ
jgi:tetratricopeptide (TPR) repeat protein